MTTCLLSLLRECTPSERERLATLSGTSENYLYLLATGVRHSPNARLAAAIEDASRVIGKRIVTMRDLATMNDIEGFTGVN